MTFRCGRCVDVIPTDNLVPGQTVTCQRCQHVNVVPEPLTAPPPAPVATPVVVTRSAPAGARSSRGLFMAAAAAVVVAAGWGVWSYVEARDEVEDVAAPRTPAEELQRQLARQNIDHAGDPQLDQVYQRINQRHFDDGLPAIAVRWEPRLAEAGPLVAPSFTQQAMFANLGRRSVILLNPDLKNDDTAIARALSHAMVHAHLQSTGDQDVNHGPRFETVLRRLASEGAFEGGAATAAERTRLRDWLDTESVRLEEERVVLERLGNELESQRVQVERALAELEEKRLAAAKAAARARGRGAAPARGQARGPARGQARGAARGPAIAPARVPPGPSAAESAEVNGYRDAYNERVRQANEQFQRHRESLAVFNREVARYNLMLVYPDALEAWGLMQPKVVPAPR